MQYPKFRRIRCAGLVSVSCALLAAACTQSSEPTGDAPVSAPPVRVTTKTVDGVWVDPLVLDRARFSGRQRVLVELAAPDKDLPRVEPADERARTRRAKAAHRPPRAWLQPAKQSLIQRLDASTSSTVDVAYWYPTFSMIALDVTPAQIGELARSPGVVRVHADREDRPALSSSLPAIAAPWFHQQRSGGNGTSVAVLDTPIRYDNGHFGTCPSPGASGCAVAAWQSFSSQTPSEVIAYEDAANKGSHGTNVAAIVHGVAPDARLLGLNVFYWSEEDNGTRSKVSDQIDALAWVADHAETYDIVAVNMSIGGDPEGPGTCNDISRYDPIRTLWDEHGILTVISSGNDGEANATSPPGCISLAVTVGAHYDTELADYDGSCEQVSPVEREIACFSNLSGMVDLLAPGVYIDAGGYVKSGTSMAAPHVAGAIAAWQSWFHQDEGAFKTPFWMHKRLLMQSSAPHVHKDGRRYQRLDFDQSAQWDYGRSFPYWYRETTDNEIPSNGTYFETSFDVTGQGWNVQSGYLVLDMEHVHPEHVEVRLEAPDGKLAMFRLPDGQAHFTGVVGRTIEPGALDTLAGAAVDGTWTLRMRDTVGTNTGHYLQGAVYFTKEGCTPNCDGESCGDDTCGGDCGSFCLIDGTCHANGEAAPSDPCRSCIPGASASSWTAVEGKACDDGDACTVSDSCSSGVCRGEDVTCPPPGVCEQSGSCDDQSGDCVYVPLADGVTCSDDDACTVADVCESGVCTGTPVVCTPPNACMESEGCDASTGACEFVAVQDGTACPGGACSHGSCVPGETPSSPDGGTSGSGGGTGGLEESAGSDAGGCGCRTAGTGTNHAWLVALALAVLARRRLR